MDKFGLSNPNTEYSRDYIEWFFGCVTSDFSLFYTINDILAHPWAICLFVGLPVLSGKPAPAPILAHP